ncbi:predicted protein, partial [Nematostella vectensis]
MTDCQTKRAAALQGSQGGLQPVGRFLPSCDVKGAYEKVQCWGSIGFCWCVDSSGNEIKGTRVRGTPSCDTTPAPTASGLTDCQLRRHQAAGLLGAFRPLCDNAGAYEKVQSHEGYYWCVDSQGREINGTRLRFNKPTNCTSNSNSGPRMMVGRYVPQCDKDGSFHQVQCHPSTGFCWCVNTTSGIVVRNTQTRGRPDC